METLRLSQLKYPDMRKELIDYLNGLSDQVYQHRAWVENNRPEGGHDELDYAIHFLYDDTDLADDPDSLIGWILTGEEEVSAIANLVEVLNSIFDKYGTTLSDYEYITKDEWKNVLTSAKNAKNILLMAK